MVHLVALRTPYSVGRTAGPITDVHPHVPDCSELSIPCFLGNLAERLAADDPESIETGLLAMPQLEGCHRQVSHWSHVSDRVGCQKDLCP